MLAPCATVMASVLWEQRRGNQRKGGTGLAGGGCCSPSQAQLYPTSGDAGFPIPYLGRGHRYRLGLSEFIYELSPNTHRKKKEIAKGTGAAAGKRRGGCDVSGKPRCLFAPALH